MVGPDAYRLITEFVLSRLDEELDELVGNIIVGAVRHVDDYYIGLRSEYEAQAVLSHLRETLALYELNLNDQKTQIYSSLEPINDLWAQRLRDHMIENEWGIVEHYRLERSISEAIASAVETRSDSPIKILFRSFDEAKIYNSQEWTFVEQHIQRIVQKHPHAIDYACLLVAKRHSLGREIDEDGWLAVAEIIITRSLTLDHQHEAIWMFWLLIVCDIEITSALPESIAKSRNAHLRAILIQAYVDGKVTRKPKMGLGNSLSTVDANWLVNLISRSQAFSKAPFSGMYSSEFDHLADRNINLIDFELHIEHIRDENRRAISRTRYGYDDDDDEEDDEDYDYPF
ncbi:RNA-directed DNA polymerase [Sphingopyxis sp. BSNA05]|uniref:RNA-directed DNA polymerase n=1 Tax=Sphingopyxis sp. BSNA05 TaxID=1236614 RepID=UPI00156472B7|nr:RNA-directed DNA polymerase [Sphingopyxis sp. BSNA05]